MQTFKRGQVIQALWYAFTLREEAVPTPFSTKIRKMGELGVPLTAAEKAGQPGLDNNYTAYHAFELGVALKLLDAGFKQGEVAILVQQVRPKLRTAFTHILESPPAIGMNVLAKDRPNSPPKIVVQRGETELGDPSRHHSADTTYWLTFRSLEFPQLLHPKAKKGELRFEPQFHKGFEALAAQMERLASTYGDDHRFVLELSNLAQLLDGKLPLIRPAQRGRQ
jgi:hypothetical protein